MLPQIERVLDMQRDNGLAVTESDDGDMSFATMDGDIDETDDLLWPDTHDDRQALPTIGPILDATEHHKIFALCEAFGDTF